jgi:hypothetical protein
MMKFVPYLKFKNYFSNVNRSRSYKNYKPGEFSLRLININNYRALAAKYFRSYQRWN